MPRLLYRWGILLGCLAALVVTAQDKKDDKKKDATDHYLVMLRDEVPLALISQMDKATRLNTQLAALAGKKDDKIAEGKAIKLKEDQKKAAEETKRQLTAATAKAESDANRLVKDLDRLNERLDKDGEKDSTAVKKQIDEAEARLAMVNELRDAYNVLSDYCAGQVGQNSPFFLVGMPALSLSGPLFEPEGKAASLADYGGRVVVLVFFATQNPGSTAILQDVVATTKNYKETDVIALGINVDPEREPAKASIVGKVKCPVIYDTDRTAAKQYRVKFLPQVVLIGRDGSVMDLVIGRSNRLRGDLKRKLDDAVRAAKDAKPAAK